MIVDVHAHYHPRAYREALARLPGFGGGSGFAAGTQPVTDDESHVQARLEMMAAAGVGVQVLSPAAGWAPYAPGEAAAAAAARVGNDLTAALAARLPERFKALVSLPLPHVDASLRELRRGLDELGMIGVNIHCSVLNRPVVEPEFLPLYEELDRRRAVVLFHPTGNGICSPLVTDFRLSTALGTSLEDTTVALHLVARRIPAQFPNITFIVPHLGGPLAMLLERLDNQFSAARYELAEPPSVTARRFYYDTVGHGSHAALLCAWKAFGAAHLLPGSDFPVLLNFETYARTFAWIREVGLPADDVEQILERTAPEVLGLPASR
ncbi:MAG TPA: amidohydrolase family protein [Chloroflexota bacterium]|nr:amidohydrolase family protein [Chloroflexota bacterium]